MPASPEQMAVAALGNVFKKQCTSRVSNYLLADLRAMGLPDAEMDPRSATELSKLVARITRNATKRLVAEVTAKAA